MTRKSRLFSHLIQASGLKKNLLLLCCLFFVTVAFGQVTTDSISFPSKEQLIKKSRVQKSFGWFMVGTGIPVVLACTYFLTFPADVLSEKGKVAAALTGGAVYTFLGIKLVQKGAKNKQRALSLGMGPKRVPTLSLARTNVRLQPAVILRLGF